MRFVYSVLGVCCLLAAASTLAADAVILKSGNAPVGQADPLTAVQGYNLEHYVEMPQQAVVCPRVSSSWANPIDGTQWVSINAQGWGYGGQYKYEIHFVIPVDVETVSLTMTWGGDDGAWAYINGTDLGCGLSGLTCTQTSDQSLFQVGDNVLLFTVDNARIGWNPTVLDFYPVVDYAPSVPEPSAILASLMGLSSAFALTMRKRIAR